MHQEHVDPGRSFGGAAELYDRLRYTPSDQVLTWLLSGRPGGRVLDLASGTGQIARRLTDDVTGRDGTVFALEPDPRMRGVLRARVPRATVVDGMAESIPLAAASIDTALAGSAWHWFNQSQALTEIARVLRDDGVLGVLGTTPDISVDWVRDLFIPEGLHRLERAQQAYINVRLPSGDFGPVEYASFGGRQSIDREDLAESFKTHSYYRTAGPERQATIVEHVRTTLAVRFPGASTIELATRTVCWRARRTRRGGGVLKGRGFLLGGYADRMTGIQPELWIDRAAAAVAFYEAAFGARVLHQVGDGDEIVAQLAIGDAAFWVSSGGADGPRFSPRAIGGATGRILLLADDPDVTFARAVEAGATPASEMADEHGWRLGRIFDPFGHEWEIGRPLGHWPPA